MKRIICFDIESTGTDPSKDRIIQLALSDGNTVSGDWLVNPGIPIPEASTEVHGFTDAMVADRPSFRAYATEIHSIVRQADLLGFNLSNFDIPILWEEFYRCGIEWDLSETKIFDAGALFKKREERTLAAALKFYCDQESEGLHDAKIDVSATWDVWNAQLKRYGLQHCDRATLAKESAYDEVRVDLAGKIIIGKDGRPTYNIGKVNGTAVEDDLGFAHWMLDRDFSQNTKMHLMKILNSEPAEQTASSGAADEPF